MSVHELAARVFDWGVSTSWDVALLVVAVLLVQGLCARWLTPRWRYGLWLLVVARLCLPAVPQVPLGAPRVLAAASPAASVLEPAAPQSFVRPAADSIPRPRPRAAHEEDPARATLPAGAGEREAGRTRSVSSPLPTPLGRRRSFAPLDARPFPWRTAAVGLWLAIAALLLACNLRLERRFRRRLRGAVQVTEAQLEALLAECRGLLGVRRQVELLRTDLVASPALCGPLRPRLLLPEDGLERFDERDLRHVLLHELAHLKHGDLAVNALVLVLACTFWFHPLVWVAFIRLRSAQESARDWEALDADPAKAPIRYAFTLLKLLEGSRTHPAPPRAVGFLSGSRDLKRRIDMIANFHGPSRVAGFVGGALLVALAWTSFTSAAPSLLPLPDGEGTTQREGLQSIAVERHQEPPAWKQDLAKRLEQSLDVDAQVSLSVFLDWLRAESGINLVVQRDFLEDRGDPEVALRVGQTTVAGTLELLGRVVDDLGWCLAREAVFIGERGDLPESRDLRFYKVDPLLEDASFWGADASTLIDLVMTFTQGEHGPWDMEGTSIEYWNGLLMVTQTDAMHARVKSLLERLLNRGRTPVDEEPEWKRRLLEALGSRTDVDADGQDVGTVVATLQAQHAVPILVDEDTAGETITLELANVQLATALAWIADLVDRRVTVDGGAILLTEGWGTPRLEFYEMGELYDLSLTGSEEIQTRVVDLMRDFIEPDSWDEDWLYGVVFWTDLMLVNQGEAAHPQIADLLAAMRRALR